MKKYIPVLLLLSVLILTGCATDTIEPTDNIIEQVLKMIANGFSLEFLQGNPQMFIGLLRAMIFFFVFTLVFVAMSATPLHKLFENKKGAKIAVAAIISLTSILVPTNIILTFLFLYSTIAWIVLLIGPICLIAWYIITHKAHTRFGMMVNGLILIGLGAVVNVANKAFQNPASILEEVKELTNVSLAEATAIPGILFKGTNWLSAILIIWGVVLMGMGLFFYGRKKLNEDPHGFYGMKKPDVNPEAEHQAEAAEENIDNEIKTLDDTEAKILPQEQRIKEVEDWTAKGMAELKAILEKVQAQIKEIEGNHDVNELANTVALINQLKNTMANHDLYIKKAEQIHTQIANVQTSKLKEIEEEIPIAEKARAEFEAEYKRLKALPNDNPEKSKVGETQSKMMQAGRRADTILPNIKKSLKALIGKMANEVTKFQREQAEIEKLKKMAQEATESLDAKDLEKADKIITDMRNEVDAYGKAVIQVENVLKEEMDKINEVLAEK